MKAKAWIWFGNLFVLPDGRRIHPLLVFVPVVLIVGAFAYHLYQESLIRPTMTTSNPLPLETGIETALATQETPNASPPLEIQPMAIPQPQTPPTIYSIRLGLGRQMDFVNRALSKLKNDQHDAFYQKVGDQYWVLVGRFTDPTRAESQLKSITSSGKYKGEVVTLSKAYRQ